MAIRVIFFGTPAFAAQGLQALLTTPAFDVRAVVTQPDRPAGRGGGVRQSPVKTLAQAHGVSVLQPEKIRATESDFLATANSFGPFDVGIVIAFGQILPPATLALARCGCINVHASLLPRWRGAAPIQRAILAGDKESGVCLMQMDPGLDTGPVYSRHPVAIAETDTAGDLHDKLAATGAAALLEIVPLVVAGTITPTPQVNDGVTYAKKLSDHEAAIDWHQSAEQVLRSIRGFNPFPGAFTFLNGKRMKIYAGRKFQGSATCPTGFLDRHRGALIVGCADGIVELEEVQLEGKKKMLASALANGMTGLPAALLQSPQ